MDSDTIYFFIAMSLNDLKNHEITLQTLVEKEKQLAIYCFDVWQPVWREWGELFNKIKPRYLFFAYKQTSEYFKSKAYNAFWVPQAMSSRYFHEYPIQKTRLFIQIGRRTEALHAMVMKYLENHNLEKVEENYIYEKEKGVTIFPEITKLAEEIAKSKYFIAAPQCLEGFEKTGNISEVTARFYEAMACKTLIVGIKPKTFEAIFPSDAMLEVRTDGSDFDQVIDYYESNISQYQELVEKNYKCVTEKHTWSNRFEMIINAINNSSLPDS